MRRTVLKSVPMIALLLPWLAREAAAQEDPTRQWFVCHGPQTAGRMPPPKKIWVSDVSTVTHVTGKVTLNGQNAFQAFVLKTYGVEFVPWCDWLSSEAQARRIAKSYGPRPGLTVVQTGWVWKPTAADTALPVAEPRKPGSLPQ